MRKTGARRGYGVETQFKAYKTGSTVLSALVLFTTLVLGHLLTKELYVIISHLSRKPTPLSFYRYGTGRGQLTYGHRVL